MDRSTHSTARTKHLTQNLNSLDVNTNNNNSTSSSKKKTAQPTLHNIPEKSGKKIYQSIQYDEQKNKNSTISADDFSYSFVELLSDSDEEVQRLTFHPSCEPTLSSRPSSKRQKNNVAPFVEPSIHFFKHMPENLIRKILFEHFIDLNDIPTTANNLMQFASISKFNREYIRKLLLEEGLHEFSFEITKLAIPDLLVELANDKKAKFTQADIDDLVHNWPYLTFDSSHTYEPSLSKYPLFTNRGIEALKKIVCHPKLQEVRIDNSFWVDVEYQNKEIRASNNNCMELLYELLSRKSSVPLKVDIDFFNWAPPYNSNFQINEKSFNLLGKIVDKANKCKNLTFGMVNIDRINELSLPYIGEFQNLFRSPDREYQHRFVLMMCAITLSHSAEEISINGVGLSDGEMEYVVAKIHQFDKSTLQYLDLSGNYISEATFPALARYIQSKETCLNTLKLNKTFRWDRNIKVFLKALKKNHSLQLVELSLSEVPHNHPIRNDKRVRLTE